MTYSYSTMCEIARVLGIPEVSDDLVRALLREGKCLRWKESKYKNRYMAMVEYCLSEQLTWEDCKETATIFWVRIQEQKCKEAKEEEVWAKNRVIELLKNGQYDEAEKRIAYIKENILWIAANIRVEIENAKSKYPNADWNFKFQHQY